MQTSSIVIAFLILGLFVPFAHAQTAADSAQGARDAIKAIWEAAQVYYQDKGEWPKDLAALTDSGHSESRAFPPHLTIPRDVRRGWTFKMDYNGPPNLIHAVSKTRRYKSEGGVHLPVHVDYETAMRTWGFNDSRLYDRDTLTHAEQAEVAAEVIKEMREMDEAAMTFYKDKGSWPEAVKELEADRYIIQQQPVGRLWQIAIIGSPPQFLIAVSTEEMPGGEGRGILYDLRTKTFSGYGVK